MKRLFALPLMLLTGCTLFQKPARGDWELEVEEADACGMEISLEQDGEDLFGDADVDCRIYFSYDGQNYYYDVVARGESVEGSYDFDDGEVELELSFHDDGLDVDIELVLEGELDEGEFEGELYMNDEFFGDVIGDVSQ
jgi:hypothetical protein